MKKAIVILFLIGALGLIGFFQAAPISPEGFSPRIEISPQSFNFGQVKYGEVLATEFLVENRGQAVLEIKKVATSCSCTTAQINNEKTELQPGEKAVVKVRYDTGAMGQFHGKGEQERIIYIRSNDPLNPQREVTIFADVE